MNAASFESLQTAADVNTSYSKICTLFVSKPHVANNGILPCPFSVTGLCLSIATLFAITSPCGHFRRFKCCHSTTGQNVPVDGYENATSFLNFPPSFLCRRCNGRDATLSVSLPRGYSTTFWNFVTTTNACVSGKTTKGLCPYSNLASFFTSVIPALH